MTQQTIAAALPAAAGPAVAAEVSDLRVMLLLPPEGQSQFWSGEVVSTRDHVYWFAADRRGRLVNVVRIVPALESKRRSWLNCTPPGKLGTAVRQAIAAAA